MRSEREQEIHDEIDVILTIQQSSAKRLRDLLAEQCTLQSQRMDRKDDEVEAAMRRWWHRPLGLTKETTGWRFGPVKEI